MSRPITRLAALVAAALMVTACGTAKTADTAVAELMCDTLFRSAEQSDAAVVRTGVARAATDGPIAWLTLQHFAALGAAKMEYLHAARACELAGDLGQKALADFRYQQWSDALDGWAETAMELDSDYNE